MALWFKFLKFRLAPHFNTAFLCLTFMALGTRFTLKNTKRASRQDQFEWCRLKFVGAITV